MYKPIKTKGSSIAFRERTFRIVHAAVGTHGGDAAGILNVRWLSAPALAAGGMVSDYGQVFADLGRELEQSRARMLDANNAHLGQLAILIDLQKRRDELNLQLFDRFYKGRHTLESLYGRTRGFEVLAVDGETPRDPSGLIQQVRSTVTFLEEPKVVLPAPDVDGIAVDLPVLAFQLGTGADDLEGVLRAVEEQQKNAQTTRKAKNDAFAEFDRRYLWVGRALETYFHLAGMHELAERVRPSARRPGRRAADENMEPDAVEAEGDEAQADEETAGETPDSEAVDA